MRRLSRLRLGPLLLQPHLLPLPPPAPRRSVQTVADSASRVSPRREYNEAAKRRRRRRQEEEGEEEGVGERSPPRPRARTVPGWDLFVGIEIHAQLNSATKLFSGAANHGGTNLEVAGRRQPANSHTALFDLATPGSQPVLQPGVLIPALRAALALGCAISAESEFDRKHYFWWDQPAGYQITQHRTPLACDGAVVLRRRDGIATEDGRAGGGDDADGVITVPIRRVQLEQDTAKTVAQPGGQSWLDFNRAGVALVEIVTEPVRVQHGRTAAALVRKIQTILLSVDACVSGMEAGGLRADVNVSVRRRLEGGADPDPAAPLGVRTEIKNLSSVGAIEDAILAERDRQIGVLGGGGAVVAETRGWTLGGRETHRLRGKEGEVDYRYMADPDIPPLRLGADLIAHLRETLPAGVDGELDSLVARCGISDKDAVALMSLDGGRRLLYLYNVLEAASAAAAAAPAAALAVPPAAAAAATPTLARAPAGRRLARLAANWVLNEFGRLTSERTVRQASAHDVALPSEGLVFTSDGDCSRIPAAALGTLLQHLDGGRIQAGVCKRLVMDMYESRLDPGRDGSGVAAALDSRDLWFREIAASEYDQLVGRVRADCRAVWDEVGRTRAEGKVMFLVGRVMAAGPRGRVDPARARECVVAALDGAGEA